jgi:hypothetical protein
MVNCFGDALFYSTGLCDDCRHRQAEFDRTKAQLRQWAGIVISLVDDAFPPGYSLADHPELAEFARTDDEPFYRIRKAVENVRLSYDRFADSAAEGPEES